MKIIHITLGKANPNRMNGVNKVVYELASIQTLQNLNVEVWGLSNSLSSDNYERPFKLFVFKRNKYFLDKNLLNAINSNKDTSEILFHIHGAFIFDFYLIARLLTKQNIKYIYTSHGAFNEKAYNKKYLLKRIYFQLFEKFIIKNAIKTHVIAESELEGLSKLDSNITNKVLIPNGINIANLKFSFNVINKTGHPVFCYCGRIDIVTKGIDILINGYDEYIKNKGKGVLWIIGDGNDLNRVKAIVKEKGLLKNVVFWGAKFGEEKFNLIKNADVFILTSRNDVFPTAVIEAAALGKPLLISKETNFGTSVIKHDCGLVLEKNSFTEVSKLLTQFELYSQEDLIIMEQNAINMIKNEFDIVSISNRLLENVF